MHLTQNTFRKYDLQALAISADQPFSQKAFSRQMGLPFPLLSDRDLKVIKACGVYDRERGTSERAYFLVNKEGKILWQHVMKDPARALETEALLKAVQDHLQ